MNMVVETDNKNNLGNTDTTKEILFVRVQEKVQFEEQAFSVSKSTIGHSWICGSSTNGIVGTNTNTQDGQQQVVGGAGRVSSTQLVVSSNNSFKTRFANTSFKDSPTTADWLGGGVVDFTNTEIAQSTTICNFQVITNAKIFVDDDTNLTLYLSADGGSHWEEVTNNTLHTFTNSGSDLRFKLVASGVASITFLKVEYG